MDEDGRSDFGDKGHLSMNLRVVVSKTFVSSIPTWADSKLEVVRLNI